MYSFPRPRCSQCWPVVIAVLTVTTSIAVQAQSLPSHSAKTAMNRSTQPEAAGSGGEQVHGTTFVGSMGITETVDEIMARQRAYDAQSHVLQGPHETKPEPKFELHQQPNPAAPDVPQWPPRDTNTLISAIPLNPQTVGTNFLAVRLGETPGFVPPDTIGAVGPTQIMATANGRLKVFDKTGALAMCGGVACLNVDMDTFWASVRGSSGVSDQHVRYDRLSQRWFVVGINVANTSNLVLVAVSSGSAISSTSSFTFFQFSEGASNFFDYPTLGIDANALYVGANMFTSSVGSFVGTNGYVIRKSSVTGGGPIVVTTFNNIGTNTGGIYTPQGVDNDDPNSTEGYFIGIDAALFSTLDICRVSNPGGAPTINCSISLTVPATTNPINVPAFGTSTTLDGSDGRLLAAAMHKNKNTGVISLWTAHSFEVNSSGVATPGGGRDGMRWYEIKNMTGTPALNQSGTLFDSAASNPVFYWMGSAAMSGQGHMALGASSTQATTFTGISVAGRLAGDALGVTEAPTVAQAGVAAYDITVTNPQRWGDFSQTVVDPTDDMTMWTVQEYANTTNSWGTRVVKLIAPPPAAPSSASPSSVAAGQSAVSVAITGTSSAGTGFFDPGPDTGGPGYPNHIAATVTGGVTVNSVTYTDSTHVTLSLNTTAATTGLKNVTITNPDGQSATGISLLTITPGASPPTISKAFGAATIPLNGTTSLTFTITNPNASVTLHGVGFSDTLPSTTGALVVANPPSVSNTCGGTVTATAGTGLISLSGGTVNQSASCTLSVNVQGTAAGDANNTTGAITSTEGGTGATSNTATVKIVAPPTISKSFGAPRIAVTGTAVLSFTISNPNTGTTLTGIGFSDTLPSGLVINTPNGLTGSCGGGTITATQGTSVISLSGATLTASGSCMFSVTVLGTAGGDQNNTTGNVTSNEGGTGGTASATINVIAPPTLSLAFNPTTIVLNATTSLQFTITNPAVNTTALNGVAFTDTLPAGLTVANSSTTVCGGTLTTTNPTTIHLSGGTVNQNSQCIFSVIVTGAAAGNFSNSVSGAGSITSTTGGIGATGPPSNTANLTVVAPPTISKSFSPKTIALNSNSTLSFTVTNPNTTSALSGIAFTDSLPGGVKLASTTVTGSCGSGTITATINNPPGTPSTVSLSGGTLTASPAAGSSCTFSVSVTGISPGAQLNTTGNVSSTEGGTGGTASDTLTVVAPATISKSFSPKTIALNSNSTLSFTVANPNTASALSGIAFTDSLPGGLKLAATTVTGSCASGTITATINNPPGTPSTVNLSGATLTASPGAGSSCTFSVNVTGISAGAQVNTTGTVSSTEGGTGGTATDTLTVVSPPTISKSFSPKTIALNSNSTLSFTVTNPNTASALSGVAFTDSLPGGLKLASTTVTGSCGSGTITATINNPPGSPSTVSLSGGTLTASPAVGSSCTFSVSVTGISAGAQVNTTGTVSSTEGGTGGTASDTLTVIAPPTISKQFGHTTVPLNQSDTLSFTVTNPNTTSALSGIAFTDTLPGGLKLASTTVTGSCGSGTITATINNPPGTPSTVSLSGGTLTASPAAGSSCTFSVSVTGISVGAQLNTTSTVSSTEGGTGGTASATLTVVAPPTISKMFGAASISLSGSTSLSFTINNPNTGSSLSGIGFTDTLPSGLVISTPNGLTGSCGGGAITATQGTSVISLSGGSLGASSGCTFSVNVTGTTAGTQNNVTGNVTSTEGGTGGTAAASVKVGTADIALTNLTHMPDPASFGGRLVFTATVKNNGPNDANVTFTETFVGNQYFVSAAASQGSCTPSTTSCNLGLIVNGQTATVTVTVTPLLGSSIRATATATGDLSDPNLSNNTMNDSGRVRIKPRSLK